jgi:hypothetical protein
MSQFKITIDESIALARAEEALRGLPYELMLTADRARFIRPGSRQSLRSLSIARAIGSDENKCLDAALGVLGGDSRHRRAARFLYAHSREPRHIYVTSDLSIFGPQSDERRQRLAALFGTQIMTLEEFETFCDKQRRT